MKDENDNRIDVTNENESELTSPKGNSKKFKTVKLFRDDIKKGFYKPPQTLWDESFVGEAIADECHPENSSFAIGTLGTRHWHWAYALTYTREMNR
jgi:hypothetical protein